MSPVLHCSCHRHQILDLVGLHRGVVLPHRLLHPVLSSLSMPKRKLVMAATSVDGTEGVAFVVTGWTVATWGVFGG